MDDWFLLLSWGSPVGLAIFFIGLGTFIYLLARADAVKRGKDNGKPKS